MGLVIVHGLMRKEKSRKSRDLTHPQGEVARELRSRKIVAKLLKSGKPKSLHCHVPFRRGAVE